MTWSRQQDAALKAIAEWLRQPYGKGRHVFRLFGYAGTGKTTIAKEVANMPKGRGGKGTTLFASYTGKAALVMRQKGCDGATTIHGLIYKPVNSSVDSPEFELNRESAAMGADLVVIDECSMVDERIGQDLMTVTKKILVLGDPFQLPPLEGTGYFTARIPPDAILTEVHRQALGSPIISMATMVREGGRLGLGEYGESRVIDRAELSRSRVLGADQVLCGRHVTRIALNERIRQLRLSGGDPQWSFPLDKMPTAPVAGERLVCLRNKRRKGLLNGGIWTVRKVNQPRLRDRNVTRMILDSEDVAGVSVDVGVPNEFFVGREKEVPEKKRNALEAFTYGYALTGHKAQGSQWGSVVVFDESFVFGESADRWLYTCLTRAADVVTVVRGKL